MILAQLAAYYISYKAFFLILIIVNTPKLLITKHKVWKTASVSQLAQHLAHQADRVISASHLQYYCLAAIKMDPTEADFAWKMMDAAIQEQKAAPCPKPKPPKSETGPCRGLKFSRISPPTPEQLAEFEAREQSSRKRKASDDSDLERPPDKVVVTEQAVGTVEDRPIMASIEIEQEARARHKREFEDELALSWKARLEAAAQKARAKAIQEMRVIAAEEMRKSGERERQLHREIYELEKKNKELKQAVDKARASYRTGYGEGLVAGKLNHVKEQSLDHAKHRDQERQIREQGVQVTTLERRVDDLQKLADANKAETDVALAGKDQMIRSYEAEARDWAGRAEGTFSDQRQIIQGLQTQIQATLQQGQQMAANVPSQVQMADQRDAMILGLRLESKNQSAQITCQSDQLTRQAEQIQRQSEDIGRMAEEIEKHRKVQSQSKLTEKIKDEEVKEFVELRGTCITKQLAIEKLEKGVESVRKSANEQVTKSQAHAVKTLKRHHLLRSGISALEAALKSLQDQLSASGKKHKDEVTISDKKHEAELTKLEQEIHDLKSELKDSKSALKRSQSDLVGVRRELQEAEKKANLDRTESKGRTSAEGLLSSAARDPFDEDFRSDARDNVPSEPLPRRRWDRLSRGYGRGEDNQTQRKPAEPNILLLQAKFEEQERSLKSLARSKVDLEMTVAIQANELARFHEARADEGRQLRRELELDRRRDLEVEERLKEELGYIKAREDQRQEMQEQVLEAVQAKLVEAEATIKELNDKITIQPFQPMAVVPASQPTATKASTTPAAETTPAELHVAFSWRNISYVLLFIFMLTLVPSP